MTDWAMHSSSRESQILPARLAEFLKRQGSAKQLSLRLDVDLRTMNNLRAGATWPIARHWWNIWVEFGDDVLEAVFHPERVEARLTREAAERETARRQRIATATVVESRAFGMAVGLEGEGGQDAGPEPLGPPNLDLFEDSRT